MLCHLFHETECFQELLLRLSGETHDAVCGYGSIGQLFSNCCYDLEEAGSGVPPAHVPEYVIVTTLEGHIEAGSELRVVGYSAHYPLRHVSGHGVKKRMKHVNQRHKYFLLCIDCIGRWQK